MAEKAKLRECTEEELFLVEKEKPKKGKVVPISNAVRVVPEPVQLLPDQNIKPTSWYKKNQTILIIAGAVLLISLLIIWQELEKEKKKKTTKK